MVSSSKPARTIAQHANSSHSDREPPNLGDSGSADVLRPGGLHLRGLGELPDVVHALRVPLDNFGQSLDPALGLLLTVGPVDRSGQAKDAVDVVTMIGTEDDFQLQVPALS